MPKLGLSGSVRGASRKGRPYRDRAPKRTGLAPQDPDRTHPTRTV
jgi:hypothetical protein